MLKTRKGWQKWKVCLRKKSFRSKSNLKKKEIEYNSKQKLQKKKSKRC